MGYSFSDVVDLEAVEGLMESLWSTWGVPAGIIDVDGTLLVMTGRQEICRFYHCKPHAPSRHCLESDPRFARRFDDGQALPECGYIECRCKAGLVDIVVPIVIGESHLANLFLGQFLYAPPDRETFGKNARAIGVDEDVYLKALEKTPVFSRSKIEQILDFYSRFVGLLTQMGVQKRARLEAQKTLVASERRFRTLYIQTPVMLHSIDRDGRLVEVSDFWLETLGYGREEVLGRRPTEFMTEASRSYAEEVGLPRFFRTGEARNIPYQLMTRDGEVLDVLLSATAERDESGALVRGLAVMVDVTERVRAEGALREALAQAREEREKVAAIVTSVAEGLLVTDTHQRVVMMNEAAEALLGMSFGEIRHQSVLAIPDADGMGEQVAATLKGCRERRAAEWETRTGRTVHARTTEVRGDEGVNGAVTILRDVTRQRQLDRMKNEFLNTAAHELRTPLTAVKGFAELLIDEQFTPDQQSEYLSYIFQNAQNLETIIDDLLNLSRVESGRTVHLDKEILDLGELLGGIIEHYRQEHAGHRFELELPEGRLRLWADPDKLMQVLENLLSNAVKFSQPGTQVAVRCDTSRTETWVTVTDQGKGMTEEEMEHIFDKFYRADATNSAVAGLGLGMAVAKAIVDAHGGRITVESAPGEGTRVTFTLSLAADQ